MKVNYYGYALHDREHRVQFLHDIRPFVDQFCAYNNPTFKQSFTLRGEYVYLTKVREDSYLFLMTRSNEIIKRISSTDLSVSDLYDLLDHGEQLGFTSYVYLQDSYFGFAATMMAPRFRSFSVFMSDLLDRVGLGRYEFKAHPLMTQGSRMDALRMEYLGRSVVQVTQESTLFETVRAAVKGTVPEFSDVDAFEIIIKPRRTKNIKPAISRFIKELPDDGLDKMMLRAKEELGEQTFDLYIAGKGIVYDELKKGGDHELLGAIVKKASENEELQQKVRHHEQDTRFEQLEAEGILRFHEPGAWSDHFRDI